MGSTQDGSLSWQHESSITSLYAGNALELVGSSTKQSNSLVNQQARHRVMTHYFSLGASETTSEATFAASGSQEP